MRELMNALFFVLRGGCPWRMLPEHFPPHQTAYRWFTRFRDDGTWENLNHHLVMLDRERVGRESSPSAAIIDSQSVKTTEAGGSRGYDAGKKINGRKREAMVDTDGRGLILQVHAASVQDRDGAIPLLQASRALYPFIERVFADSAYAADRVATATRIIVEIVRKQAGQIGFGRASSALGWSNASWPGLGATAASRTSKERLRVGNSLPLCRFRLAAHTTTCSPGLRSESDPLELSGIGQPEHACATSAGRGCTMSCPGSVRTLAIITFRAPPGWSPKRVSPSTTGGRGVGLAHQALRYALFRQRHAGRWPGAPIRAFVCSREGLEAPDLMLGWIPMLTEPQPARPEDIAPVRSDPLCPYAMRPESKGHVHIAAAR